MDEWMLVDGRWMMDRWVVGGWWILDGWRGGWMMEGWEVNGKYWMRGTGWVDDGYWMDG